LGKFLPNLLSAFYILLALLPITALPLLFGGVTGPEFWRRALALVNALFVSLATGMLVSAFHRDAQRAMMSALAVVLLLVAVVPGLIYLGRQTRLRASSVVLGWLSPLYAYWYSADTLYARHRNLYWGPLLGSALLALVCLSIAGNALPRLWREGAIAGGWAQALGAFARNRTRRLGHSARLRQELLSKNPMSWLMGTELGIPWAAWAVVLAWGLTVVTVFVVSSSSATPLALSHYGVAPFGFVFKVLFALQACKFFAEARRTGSLELLLCTPLTNREVVRGVAFGLWHAFCLPLVGFLVVLFAPLGLGLARAFWSRQVEPAFGAFGGSVLGGIYTVRMLMDLLAICWFGMGLALTLRKPQLAPALTILYVLILPAILSACFLDVVPDVFFIIWGMAKTRTDLRHVLVQQYAGR